MGSTRAWTSSGRTWSRPARAAYARAARRRWRLARGDAPKRRAGVERVAVVRSTTYCLMAALACIVRTVSISLATVSPSVTGAIASRGNAPPWLSSDITGVSVFNQDLRDFEFRPGAIFANVVVGDEINRASPKTQSAMLECMEEGQVTVDGQTYELHKPFIVMATQNPIEME